MLAPDANILIYAYNRQSAQFQAARDWLEATLLSGVEVGLPLQSVLAFVRIVTNRSLGSFAVPMSRALDAVDGWLLAPGVRLIHPGPAHWATFRRLCVEAGISGKLSTDAHLAALAIEHEATLVTADADFARFRGLSWFDPTVSEAQ